MDDARGGGYGRLVIGVVWATLLLGLWLWGREITEGRGSATPTTGDVAAVGRPASHPLPPAHGPLPDARPRGVAIESLGVRAPVVARGLDARGAVDPPPYEHPGEVAWYRGGPRPGGTGAAVLVGHLDTRTAPAVFHRLGGVKPGARIDVTRSDGSVAEFTVEDVSVFAKHHFDAQKVYGPRPGHRAELRVITCGGAYDRARHAYSANVVVSAYLTGERPAADGRGVAAADG
ncbi:class F sortase [Streptomyces varsoviensis]|uniref:class F sortase n=1 Tax=Streptomyces varsoviensis TaxID=67373 RepID=UPI0033E3856D